MGDRFTDHRGFIEDILPGPIDCVTHIVTNKGAVRGNHIHAHTFQWVYVIRGRLLVVSRAAGVERRNTYGPGDLACDRPGEAHAWKAVQDTEVLVFTRGPRSGEGYESDTERLAVPLL